MKPSMLSVQSQSSIIVFDGGLATYRIRIVIILLRFWVRQHPHSRTIKSRSKSLPGMFQGRRRCKS